MDRWIDREIMLLICISHTYTKGDWKGMVWARAWDYNFRSIIDDIMHCVSRVNGTPK